MELLEKCAADGCDKIPEAELMMWATLLNDNLSLSV